MQIPNANVVFHKEIGKVFGHALGQGSDQHPLLHSHPSVDFREQVIHLGRRWPHLDHRIQQSGRPNHLLHHLASVLRLIVTRRGRHEDHLGGNSLPLLKPHGPVIQCRRQAKTILNQRFLPGPVTFIHGANLGNGHVGLVHHQQCVRRQVIKQGGWRLARRPARQIAGVVLDAVAVTKLHHHFHVVAGALLKALGLHQPVVIPQLLQTHVQLRPDILDRIQHLLPGRHIVRLRIDGYPWHTAQYLAGQRIEVAEVLHFIVKQLDTNGFPLRFRREHINHIAPNPVVGAVELYVVTGVLELCQPAQNRALIYLITPVKVQHHLQVRFRITQTVDGRHRRHDDRIRPFQQRLGGRQTHLFNVFVDGGIFLDEGIRRRHIGFRLVVIVVRHEILHRVIRKELLELAVQLRRQGLVVGHDDGGPLHVLDHIGDGERLA